MARCVLASSNAGKLREFQALLSNAPFDMVLKDDCGISSVEETGLTFVENAILKARFCSQSSGLSALADDSGLVIDALQGEPGVKSARYSGPNADDASNRQRVIDKLKQYPASEQPFKAHFICVLVFMNHAQDPAPIIAQGEWQGEIILQPRGQQGFGYDPIFWLPEQGCTAAELEPNDKNQLSHRAKALKILQSYF